MVAIVSEKSRLDNQVVRRGLALSRSQAENFIKLGKVRVKGEVVKKSGYFVDENSDIRLDLEEKYVSRAGFKLASVAKVLGLDFRNKIVLDVGSSTGGFTDYALQHGAQKVIAVDIGTKQLHPKLRDDKRVDLYEKTDIRNVTTGPVVRSTPKNFSSETKQFSGVAPPRATRLKKIPDIILIDVSFISLREILPHIHDYLSDKNTKIVAMLKPQFEAGRGQTNKGVIKNEAMRRKILRDFEAWSRRCFVIKNKRDSEVTGEKGNRERFYLIIQGPTLQN